MVMKPYIFQGEIFPRPKPGLEGGGRYDGDMYPKIPYLLPEDVRQTQDGIFRCGIQIVVRSSSAGGQRGDVQDIARTLLPEIGQRLAHDGHGGYGVDGKTPVDDGGTLLRQTARGGKARIIDHYIDPAKGCIGGFDGRLYCVF